MRIAPSAVLVVVHEVRTHADVAHGRFSGIGDGLDVGAFSRPPCIVGTAFLHQAQRIEDTDLSRGVAAVGHGDQNQTVGRTPPYRLRLLNHHVSDRQRIGMAAVDDAERVTDGGDIDACSLRPYRTGIVGDGDRGRLLTCLLARLEVGDCQPLALLGHLTALR